MAALEVAIKGGNSNLLRRTYWMAGSCPAMERAFARAVPTNAELL